MTDKNKNDFPFSRVYRNAAEQNEEYKMKEGFFDSEAWDSIKAILGIAAIVAIFLALICGIGWCVRANEVAMDKTFSPKEEQIRRDTFEQSKSYNDGMVQELRHDQIEYLKANPDQKAALRSIILHQYANYDDSKLPPDLQDFMRELKNAR